MNNTKILAKTLFKNIYDQLITSEKIQSIYTDDEVRNIVYFLIEHLSGAGKTDVIVNRELNLGGEKLRDLETAVNRVKRFEPIQYITGEAYFYGRKFQVNQEVLVPRRETEELVHLIVTENQRKSPKILDIGTGSGCIAITLKKELGNASVSGVDISKKALEAAKNNAKLHQVPVDFYEADVCSKNFSVYLLQQQLYHFDIIISNPPYVRNSEAQSMHKNVIEYEPHLALFVPDNDPLIFYHTIISIIRECNNSELNLLKQGGEIFFEVNESFAHEVADLLKNNDFEEIKVIKDLQMKNRFVIGRQSV